MPEEKTKSDKKILDQETIQKEWEEFAKSRGYDDSDSSKLDVDLAELQADFVQYLKAKGYSSADKIAKVSYVNSMGRMRHAKKFNMSKKIPYISERLNYNIGEITMFVDTRKIDPGLVCYTIEKIEPTASRPWVKYVPSARIIAQIHDSGVNGGTMFLSYKHKVVRTGQFENAPQIVSEDDVFYSPLTKEHALYVCKLLNVQSKNEYIKEMKRLMKEAKQKLEVAKKQKNQKTK